jgi:hypothetical protein
MIKDNVHVCILHASVSYTTPTAVIDFALGNVVIMAQLVLEEAGGGNEEMFIPR